ncbi:MAG: Shikimate dehydrogenase (NADP(+)) [Chlamydiae bacterium]|nr:Shikimate dehydrogenase (NADP(+)) [Chlamydiota bacterium]
MLIGTITGPGPDLAKRQIEKANQTCDGVELRLDLIGECSIPELLTEIQGVSILTPEKGDSSFFAYGADYLTLSWDDSIDIVHSQTKIIRSYHNFEHTPENLEEIYEKIPHADVVKIACTALQTTDALRMLLFAKEKENFIGISMGEDGQITRILGPVIGNVFDFVAIEAPAAPGQMTAQDLLNIYNYRSLSKVTKIYGLIGNPISQSPSHRTHNAYFKREGIDAVYLRMLLSHKELPLFFSQAKRLKIEGLSVTIPFKELLFEQIDHLEEAAAAIGAVNTLTFSEGMVLGANTDAPGALDALEEKEVVMGKRCTILGAGGTARAIGYEAHRRGAHVMILSRRISQARDVAKIVGASYGTLEDLGEYDILINTTPTTVPIPLERLIPRKVVMEVNVSHSNSPLMVHAKSLGCSLVYGMTMFEKQAAGQFSLWFEGAKSVSSKSFR